MYLDIFGGTCSAINLDLFRVFLNDVKKVYGPRITWHFNFSKPVTKYSLMSVMKERVLFMWWPLVSAHG